jgi:hypothetical protein
MEAWWILAQGGAASVVRRRHGLKVEDEGLLKDLVIISFFLRCFVLFDVSFNTSLIRQKNGSIFILLLILHLRMQERCY